jgi:hypothetical protein
MSETLLKADGLNVLVVDDEAILCQRLRRY